MTQRDLKTISEHLHAVPVDALQRASLLYAAKRLAASGERDVSNAIRLLEQLADEHYEQMTVTPAADDAETVVVEVE